MSKGFDMLRDYIEHDALCMRRRKCCDFEYELQQEFAALKAENERLRDLVLDAWTSCPVSADDCLACRHCLNADDDDAEQIECELYVRMRELGIEVGKDAE